MKCHDVYESARAYCKEEKRLPVIPLLFYAALIPLGHDLSTLSFKLRFFFFSFCNGSFLCADISPLHSRGTNAVAWVGE